MHRRLMSAAAGAVFLLGAFGCGSSGGSGVSAGTPKHGVKAADGSSDPTMQTVTYAGISFEVPAEWPVYDLTAAPATCVRFDVNAVYLGHSSPDMECPAGVIGRTETVQVEPNDNSVTRWTEGDESATQDVNGLSATLDTTSSTRKEIVAKLTGPNVVVEITYADNDDTQAQRILRSVRGA
jgi:hypothetical protein